MTTVVPPRTVCEERENVTLFANNRIVVVGTRSSISPKPGIFTRTIRASAAHPGLTSATETAACVIRFEGVKNVIVDGIPIREYVLREREKKKEAR